MPLSRAACNGRGAAASAGHHHDARRVHLETVLLLDSETSRGPCPAISNVAQRREKMAGGGSPGGGLSRHVQRLALWSRFMRCILWVGKCDGGPALLACGRGTRDSEVRTRHSGVSSTREPQTLTSTQTRRRRTLTSSARPTRLNNASHDLPSPGRRNRQCQSEFVRQIPTKVRARVALRWHPGPA